MPSILLIMARTKSNSTKFNNWTIHYPDVKEYHSVKREIFHDQIYGEFLDQAGLNPDLVNDWPEPVKILDLGSHIGMSVLFWKNLYPLAQVWAVEPHPALFAFLEQNIWENNLREVTTKQAALVAGDDRTQVPLYTPDLDSGWLSNSSLLPAGWTQFIEMEAQPLKVPTTTLPALIEEIGYLDIVKLDIEGTEQAVITSLGGRLSQIRHLIIEFHPSSHQSLSTLEKMIFDRGFTIKTLKGYGGLKLIYAWQADFHP